MLKNIFEKIKNAKTTVMSLASILGSILVSVNVIAQGALTAGLSATGTLYDAIVAFGLAVSGVILLFAKDDGLSV